MEEKGFGAVCKGIKYGLIRITNDLKLIDYNQTAKSLVMLPRRNARINKVLYKGGEALKSLGAALGSSVNLVFLSGARYLNSIAIRERDGNILCVLHPLFAVVNQSRFVHELGKLTSFYAKNMLLMIEEAEGRRLNLGFRMAAPSVAMYYRDMSNDHYATVVMGVEALLEKLKNTDLNKELTVVVDRISTGWAALINMLVVQFVVSELLSVFEFYGAGEKAVMHIGYSDKHLFVYLRDKLASPLTDSEKYFLRMFSEMMRMVNVGCEARIDNTGRFVIKTYIPTTFETKHLRAGWTKTSAEAWSYLDYSLENYILAQ